MERTDNATLNHRPKAVNGIGMNRPNNIFTSAVMDNAVIAPLVKKPIPRVIIGRDQADFLENRFSNENIKGFGINIIDHFRHNFTQERIRRVICVSSRNGASTGDKWPDR